MSDFLPQLNQLEFVKNGLDIIKNKESEYSESAIKMPRSSLEIILDDEFSWAEFYEIPVRQTIILLFFALGFDKAIKQSLEQNPDRSVTDSIINYVLNMMKDEDSFVNSIFNISDEPKTLIELKNLKIGCNSLFSLSDFFALQSCLLFQIDALKRHGKYMTELVEDVRKGKDESIWLAVRTDPTVLACNTFTRRMSLASLHKDQNFFQLLGTAIKSKWKKPKNDLNALRVILQVCLENKWLDGLSQNDEDRLFIKTLNVYSDDGDDPARSLHKFIYRWKNNK